MEDEVSIPDGFLCDECQHEEASCVVTMSTVDENDNTLDSRVWYFCQDCALQAIDTLMPR